MSETTATRTLPLPDGRRLSYREYGDPEGRPVVWCHGGLVCGADVSPASGAARDLGLRLLAPDRPGVGDSSPLAGRSTGDWADDVGAFADELGVERFGVAGWSMGGQYALAVAARLPDRVTTAVVIAGVPPLDDPATFDRLNRTDRTYTRLARRAPKTATAGFETMRALATYSPNAYERTVIAACGAVDADAIRGLGAGTVAAWTAEALTHPAGMVEEYLAFARPWGFAPGEVAVPTHVWQGEGDRLVDVTLGQQLAALVPGSTLHFVREEGHFLAYSRWEDVLAPFTA